MIEEMSIDEAIQLYVKASGCDSPMQPSSLSECIDGVWHLENINGPLAYVVEDTGKVIFP